MTDLKRTTFIFKLFFKIFLCIPSQYFLDLASKFEKTFFLFFIKNFIVSLAKCVEKEFPEKVPPKKIFCLFRSELLIFA